MHLPHIPHISVGNRRIDSEHRKVFEIIRCIQRSILEKDCAAIADGFRLFEEAAQACFTVEERIAHAVGFDFTLHDLAHQAMLKRYRQTKDELATRNGSWCGAESGVYANHISEWLVMHLDYESRPLRIVLDTYLYDFEPIEGPGDAQ